MKVKIFWHDQSEGLEKEINHWLANNLSVEIIEIKYNSHSVDQWQGYEETIRVGSENIFSVLILYKYI